jgi:hypothetical protein
MEAADALISQEVESMGRQLGDHGIHHIQGNIKIGAKVLEVTPHDVTPADLAVLKTAQIFHDTGYMTKPSQSFLDEGHPRWSTEHYDANIRPLVQRALGGRNAGEVSTIIRTHDQAGLDWGNEPITSAARVADNLALFHKDKLPPVFRYAKGNVQVLKDMAAKKISAEEGRNRMRANVAKSDVPPMVKQRLNRAVDEVSDFTPKFTLGMLGGEVNKIRWSGKHLQVTLKENKQNTELNKLGDFGQKQFQKFAKTYGADPKRFTKDLSFRAEKPPGNILLETIMEKAKRWLMLMEKQGWVEIEWEKHGTHDQSSHGRGGRGGGGKNARKRRALKTHKPSTKKKQDHAEKNEVQLAKKIGGIKSGDNDVIDVSVAKKGVLHGIELKTMLDNGNDKITMHPESRRRKEVWAKRKDREVHTVVLDDRDKFGNKDQHSGHRIYYKAGVGAFRLGKMRKVKNFDELNKILAGEA